MLRLVFAVLIVLAVWLALARMFRFLKRSDVDWTGVTAIIGFVVLAFYLRHATGMG